MNLRRALLVLTCVAAAAFAGLLAWRAGVFAPKPAQTAGTGTAAIGGPFKLVDQTGAPVDERLLQGRWSVVFFGYTYCPDVCPGTLQALGAAAPKLGDAARDLQVVFISIDPARDTPEQMKTYLEAVNLPIRNVGLTGTPEQVAAAAKAYRVFYQKAGEGEGYQMNHSTAAYLMDPKGRFSRVLAYGMTPDQMAQQIGAAMKGG